MRPASRSARRRSARRHRRAVACGLVVAAISGTAAVLAATADATPRSTPGRFDNALIARTALRYVGMWGGQACVQSHHDASGQCKQFVNCVVSLASGGRRWPVDAHGDYQASFPDAGGEPVSPAAAAEGDIIQVGAHDGDATLHTAIILANHHDGAFTVVDANWVGNPATPELVGIHDYTPPTGARIWRLGTVQETAPGTSDGRPDAAATAPTHPSTIAPPTPPHVAADAAGGIAAGTGPLTPSFGTPPEADSNDDQENNAADLP